MKRKLLTYLAASIIGLAAAVSITPALAQAGAEFLAKVIRTDGSPAGTLASQGTLATDKTSGALWVKTGGESTNGWVQLVTTAGTPVVTLSANGTQTPVAGSLLFLTNGFRYYVTATNGFEATTATNVLTTW